MKHSQKAKIIVSCCILIIGSLSVFLAWRALRPSQGRPYEILETTQAQEYMAYEGNYLLVDVNTREEYLEDHIEGAVSVPYEQLLDLSAKVMPDKTAMIYVYAWKDKTSGKAAMKLCELGYTNITQIKNARSWTAQTEVE